MGIIRNPFLKNPFEEYDWAAGRNRDNFLTGKIEDPVANNQQRMLSQAGVFGPSDGLNAGPPEQSTPSFDMASWLDDLREVYTKEGPASKTYREHLGSMPQYHSPSKWGKFGAALVGASEGLQRGGAAGWRAGQEAAEAPYKRELEQWGVKEQALGRQVESEDKASNRRLQYMNAVRQVAKDESEYRRAMMKFDQDEKTRQDLVNWRNQQSGRWNRQDRKEFTDDKGITWSYLPGDPNSYERVGSSLQGAQFGETKRHNRETESTARGHLGVSQGQLGVARGQLGVSQGNLTLAQQREGRIASETMSPESQSTAMKSAISRALAEDPGNWQDDFYDEDTGNLTPPDADDPVAQRAYKQFQAKIAEKYGQIMSTTRSPRVVVYE